MEDGVLTAYPPTGTPRALLVDLAVALLRRRRAKEALPLLERALAEDGAEPAASDIWRLVAHAAAISGMQGRAFRASLEAVLASPALAGSLLPRASALLSVPVAQSQAAWIGTEWSKRIDTADVAPETRAEARILEGRCHLLVGHYERAIEVFTEAARIAPGPAAMAVQTIMAPGALPPALAENDGNTRLVRARIVFSLGSLDAALEEVEHALQLGLNDDSRCPEAHAHELKARILQVKGDHSEAATWYWEAGRRFEWGGDHARAVDALRRAHILDASHVPTCWQLADALYMLSLEHASAGTLLEEARRVWEWGEDIRLPSAADSWAYVSRALITVRLAEVKRLPPRANLEACWQAVAYLERALLLNADEAYRWAYLGRYHGALGNESVALEATARAVAVRPDDEFVLEERAAILANVGAYGEAESVIDTRRAKAPNLWADAVKAFIIGHRGRARDAIALVDDVIAQEPEGDLWVREVRAMAWRIARDRERARPDFEAIWAARERDVPPSRTALAWAACCLGELKASRMLLEVGLREEVPPNIAGLQRYLGVVALLSGGPETARPHFEAGIRGAANVRHLDELLSGDLLDVEESLAAGRAAPGVAKTLDWVKSAASGRRRALEPKSSATTPPAVLPYAMADLDWVLSTDLDAAKEAAPALLAARASLARLLRTVERWEEAAHIYRVLDATGAFPEAVRGIERVLTELTASAVAALRRKDPAKAASSIAQGLRILESLSGSEDLRRGRLLTLMSCVHLLAGDALTLERTVLDAVDAFRLSGAAAGVFGTIAGEALPSAAECWALDAVLAALARATADVSLLEGLDAARAALARHFEGLIGLRQESSDARERLLIVTPIALEIGDSLTHLAEGEGAPLIRDLLPAMRERVSAEMGVRLPGVRIWKNDQLAGSAARVVLSELPVLDLELRMDRRFCPAPRHALVQAGIFDDALDDGEAAHPEGGELGFWLTAEHGALATQAGLEVWDEPAEYLVRSLEGVVRRDLARFLGVQELETMVDTWRQAPDGARGGAAWPDDRARFRLLRVLKALLRDRVPIVRWRDILEALAASGTDSIDETVRAVRLRLRECLPGNRESDHRIRVPDGLEERALAWVRMEPGTAFYAVPPRAAAELLSVLRDLIGRARRGTVLVVRRSLLRPFLRRLVAIEHPDVQVIADEELVVDLTPPGRRIGSPTS